MPNASTFSPAPPRIILCTLNAKYIHASLGLRYLLANMARHGGEDLRAQTVLREFTIARPLPDVAQALLAELGECEGPQIIGLGVYIWNLAQTTALVRLLKDARPSLKIVLGGPEVSYEWETQPIVQLADHLITGWGDVSFPKLCRALIPAPDGVDTLSSALAVQEALSARLFRVSSPSEAGMPHGPQPLMKVIAGEQPPLDEIVMPYAEYSDADLAHRLLYVEASRGCPFKCEFCLSSLDKTAWAFDLDAFLAEMDGLYQRGARNFKFVDRTFNLKIEASLRVLQFFLDRLSGDANEDLFLHFEVVPDHLPDRLKEMIARFPPGVLQFELGIQSFNPVVQQTISRRQDNAKTEANLHWLVSESHVHLHTDLIFGLPGETLASFAAGFDRLYALGPHEIQLGILKRLRGTPIARHSDASGMDYDPLAPYTVQRTAVVDATTMLRFKRLARYWDMLANSGRFRQSVARLCQGNSAFQAFLDFSDWLWQSTGKTSGLTPEMLLDALFDYLTGPLQQDAEAMRQILRADYLASGARSNPRCLRGWLGERGAGGNETAPALVRRQARHAGG